MTETIVLNEESDDLFEGMGTSQREVKKFLVDVYEDGGDTICSDIKFIWDSDKSPAVKVGALFQLGRLRGRKEGGGSEIERLFKKLSEAMKKQENPTQ